MVFDRKAWMRQYRKNRGWRVDEEKRSNASREQKRRYSRGWSRANPDKVKMYHATEYKRLKAKLVQLFGSNCVYCGCADLRVLELNHKNAGGSIDRRENTNQQKIIRAILRNERDSKDFELTCKLCNVLHYIRFKMPEVAGGFTITWRSPEPLMGEFRGAG